LKKRSDKRLESIKAAHQFTRPGSSTRMEDYLEVISELVELPGKKIQKIGFLMFWIPEPTGITCAVGGPMILAGKYLDKKFNGATIKDIGHETNNTLSSINDFKKSIS